MKLNNTYDTFDVLFAEFKTKKGSHVQTKCRPCIVVQNSSGCYYAPTLVVSPLTHIIKKQTQPTHEVIQKNKNNGLTYDSMILGEQLYTIDKTDVIRKIGYIDNQDDKDKICKCYLANLYGNKKIKIVEV